MGKENKKLAKHDGEKIIIIIVIVFLNRFRTFIKRKAYKTHWLSEQ